MLDRFLQIHHIVYLSTSFWNTSQTSSWRSSRKWRFFVTHTQTHLHFIITSINIIITIIINLFSDRGALLPGNVEAFLPLHLARNISALLPSNLQPGVVLRFLINEDEDDAGDVVGDGGDHLVALLPGHLPWDVVALLPLFLTADLDTIVVFNLFEVSFDFKIPTCFGTCFACCSHTWEDIKFGKLEN